MQLEARLLKTPTTGCTGPDRVTLAWRWAFKRPSALQPAAGGVTSITGTANQITASASTGAVTLSAPQNLHTGANFQVNSLGVGTAASGTIGEIRATNNITAYYSDDRLKNRIGNIDSPIEKLMTLNGFYYEANEKARAFGYTKQREVGVSAQEVQAVLPEIVVPAPIDENYLTVRYEKLIPLLIEAIKEQQLTITEQSAKINTLEAKLDQLIQKLEG